MGDEKATAVSAGRRRALQAAALRWAPALAFFLSGASGLVFQTIWSRLLHHVFGSSSVAISSVVSAFMGGLSLGAYIFGRIADRVRRPLLWYAAAEALVGLFAFVVPYFVRPSGPLAMANAWLRAHYSVDSELFMVARFLCIVPLLIVPTTLMGATLPLLARHFTDRSTEDQSTLVGRLYAVNTIGAVVGVLGCGFVLMPGIGVSASNAVAAGTNLALALLMFFLDRAQGAPGGAPSSVASSAPATPTRPAYSDRIRRAAAIAFALSGMAALTYEVVFARALVNTIGGSVYAFALILATFLVGIAGGSGWASALLQRGALAVAGWPLLLVLPMVALSALTTAMAHGLGAYGMQCATALGIAVYLNLLEVRSQRTEAELVEALEGGEDLPRLRESGATRRVLSMLAVPVVSSLLSLAVNESPLSAMMLTAMVAIAAFAVLVVLLRRRLLALLAALQGFIAVSTFASDLWADRLSVAFASGVTPFYDSLPEHVGAVMALMSLMAGLCVLPAALGMGAMFPVTLSLWSRGRAHVGRDVGLLYTGNTVGSIVGAWLPGFLLMPAIGMQNTLHAGIALNAGLCVLLAAAGRVPRVSLSALPAAGVATLLFYGLSLSPAAAGLRWNISKMTLGAFRISLAKNVVDEESWGAPELLYYRDGLSTTVTVERWGRHYSLKNNGKVDASSGDDMPTQIMVAAFPLLMHAAGPQDLDTAIIGFGSGVTVGAALQFPVRKVTTVELERGVVEASRYFAEVNHLQYVQDEFPYVAEPRLRVLGDDGRNHLAATPERYDVIISEPSNPWLTGVSDLFTVEHFQVSKQRLKPGGVYCQWVQLYEMSPDNVKVIYRTFASHFRHVMVFSAEERSSDTILVGSDEPLSLDLAHFRRTMEDPVVAAELVRAHVHSPQDAVARMLFASRAEVMRYSQAEERLEGSTWTPHPESDNSAPCPEDRCRRQPALLNSDDNAHIEFAAPKDLIGFERYRGYLGSMYESAWPYGRVADAVTGLGQGAERSAALSELSMSLLSHGRVDDSLRALARARTSAAKPPTGAQNDALASAERVVAGLGVAGDPPVPDLPPPSTDGLSPRMAGLLTHGVELALKASQAGDMDGAFHALNRVPKDLRRHGGLATRALHAYLAYRAGRLKVAVEALEELAELEPGFVAARPELTHTLARAHFARHHFGRAVQLMRHHAERAGDAQEAAPSEALPLPP